MNKFDDDFIKDSARRADESRQDTLDSWIVDLEEKDQPEACNIDDEDCEACGS
jgi:hypothetical protein|tara:strand:+ start:313 stop:471 length:159 start_codon:yes stop_codon:yes gene_type:complete